MGMLGISLVGGRGDLRLIGGVTLSYRESVSARDEREFIRLIKEAVVVKAAGELALAVPSRLSHLSVIQRVSGVTVHSGRARLPLVEKRGDLLICSTYLAGLIDRIDTNTQRARLYAKLGIPA